MTRSSEPTGENSVRDSVAASVRTIRDAIEGQANARPDAPFLLAPEVEATISYVALPIGLLAQDALIAHILSHSRTRIVFAAPDFVARLQSIVASIGRRIIVRRTSADDLEIGSAGQRPDLAALDPDSPALLMYTSGTTGTPKGALLSHANLIHAGRAVCDAHALTAADRVLSSLPLYHVNGQCIATVSPLL